MDGMHNIPPRRNKLKSIALKEQLISRLADKTEMIQASIMIRIANKMPIKIGMRTGNTCKRICSKDQPYLLERNCQNGTSPRVNFPERIQGSGKLKKNSRSCGKILDRMKS